MDNRVNATMTTILLDFDPKPNHMPHSALSYDRVLGLGRLVGVGASILTCGGLQSPFCSHFPLPTSQFDSDRRGSVVQSWKDRIVDWLAGDNRGVSENMERP